MFGRQGLHQPTIEMTDETQKEEASGAATGYTATEGKAPPATIASFSREHPYWTTGKVPVVTSLASR